MPHTTPRVHTGLDRLLSPDGASSMKVLRGRKVGLLVNPTSVTHDLVHAIDALRAAGVDIVRLFGPEHGVRAEAQDMEAVEQSIDPITGIPTVSLYGATYDSLTPSAEELDGLDVVVCDIQDIGARYYTYAYTIGLMMKASGEHGVEVMVLDRPNPLGGEVIEGNVVTPECRSFVGMLPLATRHGMTIGELARMFAEEFGWCDGVLHVVQMQGWSRAMWFDQTGLPWVMPSPNMPTLDTAIVYPGQCLLEGTALSEARGTTRPFELFGDPALESVRLCEKLEAYALEGARFRPTSFKPMFQKHAHSICRGAQIHVTDRDAFRSLTASLCILSICMEVMGDAFGWREQAYEFVDDVPAIDLLLGDAAVREALEAGEDPRQIAQDMAQARGSFEEQRAQYLLY